jgi:hypothetical protein
VTPAIGRESVAKNKDRMTEERAAAVALQALGFLAADAHQLGRFMSLTGIDPAELRERAATGELQAAVLDYLLADEGLLLAFCQEYGFAPEWVLPARMMLEGRNRVDD